MPQGTKSKSRSSARTTGGSGRKTKGAARRAPSGSSAPVGRAGNLVAAQHAAAAGTRAAGRAVAAAASQGKTPLIVGGAAITGLAGGLVANRRLRRSRRSRFAGFSLRDGSLDLDAVASAARRVGSLGQSVADMADAAQATQRRGAK